MTAWELGHAYARGVTIVGIHQHIRLKNAATQMNIFVYHSAQIVCASLDELRAYLIQLRDGEKSEEL